MTPTDIYEIIARMMAVVGLSLLITGFIVHLVAGRY